MMKTNSTTKFSTKAVCAGGILRGRIAQSAKATLRFSIKRKQDNTTLRIFSVRSCPATPSLHGKFRWKQIAELGCNPTPTPLTESQKRRLHKHFPQKD